jgi:hypothetical protein
MCQAPAKLKSKSGVIAFDKMAGGDIRAHAARSTGSPASASSTAGDEWASRTDVTKKRRTVALDRAKDDPSARNVMRLGLPASTKTPWRPSFCAVNTRVITDAVFFLRLLQLLDDMLAILTSLAQP